MGLTPGASLTLNEPPQLIRFANQLRSKSTSGENSRSASQSIEVRFGTSRAGAVDVALYTTASVDAVIPHPPRRRLRAAFHGRPPRAVSVQLTRRE
ncbi:hypothetical protein EOT10_40285 [Streptomyces antnestii]|uniref:Uncharacterized protein n=1 Tax=Streptomyces antnestii TaxID=2494256 RepID=A0A3S2V3V9_9ACTN|nr:hypothetical protein EOT10_40285 [Streptomyces sp. San01]